MPNAKDARLDTPKKILMLGDTGSGKTTQFLTLPGKKYAYLFDPNALLSLRGFDVDYDEFLPTIVRAAAKSLNKEKPADLKEKNTSEVYMQFETQFNERVETGFFDPYEWIGFDSATTLLDLMMDRVLSINGRLGQWPYEDDWGPQMIAFTNMCRTITGLGKNIYITGHMYDRKNRKTGITSRVPMMTGQLVQKIPLLFSEIFGCDSDTDEKGNKIYQLHTVRDKEFTVIRTSIKGLEPVEPVTIDFSKDPVGQGLGGILAWERKQSAAAPAAKAVS
jgi:hypothetical protein